VERELDEGRFGELLEESDDLQSGAMAAARTGLRDYVDAARESRYSGAGAGGAGSAPRAGVAVATGGLALATAAPARADGKADVAALQTAASIENLAVATYRTALSLPLIGGPAANPVIRTFATRTQAQHTAHGQAFNAAVQKLGGQRQTATNPKYAPIVAAAVPKIRSVADVVALAITLEDVAAQTYVRNVGLVSTPELRALFAGVAGVESQHRAILLAVQALLADDSPGLVKLPPNLPVLPAATGSAGFPDAFYPTKVASPVGEGALR
jgi:hypothetical protein